MGFEQVATLFVGVLASYGCWRGLSLLLKRPWILYVWPTLMLAFAWFMLWATLFPSQSNWLGPARELLLFMMLGVNFPAAIIGNGMLSSMIGAPVWLQSLAASAAVWLVWFLILFLWRRWSARKFPLI